MDLSSVELPMPRSWTAAQRRSFATYCSGLDATPTSLPPRSRTTSASVVAARSVVADLAQQGWVVEVEGLRVVVSPPAEDADPVLEKARVRRQELLKRDEQLRRPSVARFVKGMEAPREHQGRFVSIFSLMRDGRELAQSLGRLAARPEDVATGLRKVIDPYVQVVAVGDRCEHTGLRLTDVWRYFRLTWTNQHTNTPGRTMMILVRDRATPDHAIIGIAALSSAVVQLRERDDWIGWQRELLLDDLRAAPTLAASRWVWSRLDEQLSELYLDDLIRDGLYWPSLWQVPTQDAIDKLEAEAAHARRDHHRFVTRTGFGPVDVTDPDGVRTRAETSLFRSKRAKALADLLRSRSALLPFYAEGPSRQALRSSLEQPLARAAIAGIVRKAKADAVGTEIADLTVCGAIAPYNEILGGKLVSVLASSPTVVRAYHQRYGSYASEIASSMAGRGITRRNNLVFIGTTSLYGSGASQYNRVKVPASVLGGRQGLEFIRLGKSRSFGTSHLSAATVAALVQLAEQEQGGARVNSIFGEGVNPKLRKIRHGLDLLGWPADELLQHRRPRIIYGVPLVENLLPYLLGQETVPKYLYRASVRDDSARLVAWWQSRWLERRIKSDDVLRRMETHRLERPVRHGARVTMPATSEDHER